MSRRLILVALVLALVPAPAHAASGPGPVDAAAWAVMDIGDGEVIGSEAAGERRSIASATKLMTALVALDRLEAGERVQVQGYEVSNPAESIAGLHRDGSYTAAEMIYALLMVSANDAAVELARAAAGDLPRFAELMNQKAKALGLRDTRFSNPIGLDEQDNHSTAADLAKLSAEALSVPLIARVADTRRTVIGQGESRIELENTNALLASEPWVDGIKTGQTLNAGWVMLASGTRDGNRLVAVVLGASSEEARYASALRLLNWGFSRYQEKLVAGEGQIVARARIEDGDGDHLQLRAARELTAHLRRGGPAVRTQIEAPATVEGPIRRGERLGRMTAFAGERQLGSVPLKAARAVGAPSLAGSSSLILAIALVVVGLLVIMAAVSGARARAGAENDK